MLLGMEDLIEGSTPAHLLPPKGWGRATTHKLRQSATQLEVSLAGLGPAFDGTSLGLSSGALKAGGSI